MLKCVWLIWCFLSVLQSPSCITVSVFYTLALLDLTMLSLISIFFSPLAHTITQISSPLSYKLWTAIKQSVVFMTNIRLFLSPLRPRPPAPNPPLCQTQKTIPSYPGLAWENDKKNDKCLRKTAREMVWKGEWGGRGRDWRKWAGRKEGERQRKGKEEAGVLNKQNKWNESGAAFWEEIRQKKQQMDFWNINILTYIIDNCLQLVWHGEWLAFGILKNIY